MTKHATNVFKALIKEDTQLVGNGQHPIGVCRFQTIAVLAAASCLGIDIHTEKSAAVYTDRSYISVTEATAFTGTQSHVKHYGNAKIETIAEEIALYNVQQLQLLRDG